MGAPVHAIAAAAGLEPWCTPRAAANAVRFVDAVAVVCSTTASLHAAHVVARVAPPLVAAAES